MLERLNGLFEGIFAAESFTLSQAYYYGAVKSNPDHRVKLIEGTPLDIMDELESVRRGKPHTGSSHAPPGASSHAGPADEAALLQHIISGVSYHASGVRLLGKWARGGVPLMEARKRLTEAFDNVFPGDRDERWKRRVADVDRCLEDIYGKEAKKKDQEAAQTGQWKPGGEPPRSERKSKRADAAPGGDASWSDPLDFLADEEMTGTPELRPEHVPQPIYHFAMDTASRMGVDPAAVALSALVTCAGVTSDDWSVQPKVHDDTWTENARLWGAIVGDPSILKSPVIRACTRPVDALEARARKAHEDAIRVHKCALKRWKDEGSPPDLEPTPPKLCRYLVESTTTEALSEVLRNDSSATQTAPAAKVLVRQDEMAEFFGNLDRYKGGNGSGDRGAYLRLYNGGRYSMDRIGRGSFAVPNWSACFLGGVQPGPIQQIAKDASDDGLLQRFSYCVPSNQGRGEDRKPDHIAMSRYEDLFPVLASMHPPAATFGGSPIPGGPPQAVVLHADAHKHREEINVLAEMMSALPDTSNRLKSAFGKWPGLFARLALTFHAIEIADARAQGRDGPFLGVLSQATARMAAAYMREVLLPHLLRAEATMFATVQTGHARWIAGYILAHPDPRVTARDIVRAYGQLRAPEKRRELDAVMEGLVTMGWLRPEVPDNPARPIAAWDVNPAVETVFAERAKRERASRDATKQKIAETVAELRRRREAS